MKTLSRSACSTYLLDGAAEPLLRVESGETFSLETEDASSGVLTSGTLAPTLDNAPYARLSPPQANPVVGPIFVRDVRPQTLVRIDVLDVSVEATGVVYSRPTISHFGDSRSLHVASEPFAIPIRHQDGVAYLGQRLKWQLAPMIGTIACAPEWEPRATSIGQGAWGGNLDISDIAAGSSVFLSAFNTGGLIYVGDVHGSQGDGELIGTADESRASVTLRVWATDQEATTFPRIVTADRVIALGMGRPLEAAVRLAARHLMDWLTASFGFSDVDAYAVIGLHPEFTIKVYQMTNIDQLAFVVGASLPRALTES